MSTSLSASIEPRLRTIDGLNIRYAALGYGRIAIGPAGATPSGESRSFAFLLNDLLL
jgi:hypothetical protein